MEALAERAARRAAPGRGRLPAGGPRRGAAPLSPGTLQAQLVALYALPPQAPIGPFLCDAGAAEALLGRPPDREEMLLVGEGEEVGVSLYLAPALLERLGRAEGPWHAPDQLADGCLVLEGVSHFTYLAWRAGRGEPVTELELEVQAEVDKFALALLGEAALVGRGAGLLRASQALRERLFEGVRYRDAVGTTPGARYRTANAVASRASAALEARWLRQGDLRGAVAALRAFYRRRHAEKLAPFL